MNLRTTTPVSNSQRRTWSSVIIAIVVIATVSILWINRPVAADQYDDKIRALQANMAQYQAEAGRLNSEAISLSNALAIIVNEKNALQAQLDLSQSQYDQLIIKIADTEKQIADNQNALGSTLASLYVDDDISPIEMLASSKDISEFLNKQEYRNSIKKELSSTINRVKDLKVVLSDQKVEIEQVLVTQKAARDNLVAKEAEQAQLVAQTRNDEAEYQGLIKNTKSQIEDARATQAAINARFSKGSAVVVNVGGSDYPWNDSNCRMQGMLSTGGVDGDGKDGWGYGCRQCASYVAWRIYKETGDWKKWGNGKDFDNNAISEGYRDLGMSPESGSIAVMEPAKAGQQYGHVAWVESAYGDRVVVSQYNANINGIGYGKYTKVDVSKYSFDRYVKIK
jgi:surface antigen